MASCENAFENEFWYFNMVYMRSSFLKFDSIFEKTQANELAGKSLV